MEILNKEFWEKRDAAMKRFMASKEEKKAYGRVRADAPSGLFSSNRRRAKVCKCLVT